MAKRKAAAKAKKAPRRAAKSKAPAAPKPVARVSASSDNLKQLQDMEVEVAVELGRSKNTLDQLLELGEQSLIELNRMHGDPVDIRLNGKLFARSEVVTVAENFGVRLTEIIEEA